MQEFQTGALRPELFWLTASVLLTGVLWIPYVLNRIAEHGLWAALKNPTTESAPRADWARRMMAAHANAVENLAIFAPLVLVAVLAERTNAITAGAAGVYFVARAAHVLIYAAGVPLLRTLAFATGWAACAALALSVLGVIG